MSGHELFSGVPDACFSFSNELNPFLGLWFWSSFLLFVHTSYQIFWQRKKMAGRAVLAVGSLLCAGVSIASAQTAALTTSVADATTSYRAIFTVPAAVVCALISYFLHCYFSTKLHIA
jgi:hypothetical protein